MRWSWRIGRLAGIDVFMHFTFLFLLVWIGARHYMERQSMVDALAGIGFILLLFMVIVLHELGHALMARRFGVHTESITLLPIGGVARLDRMPEKPSEELQVAIAGPAVNVAIAILLGLVLTLTKSWSPIEQIMGTGGNLVERLFIVNLVIVVFNMIPAFPMDGGRVLRALLAMKLDQVSATRIAASVGQSLAMIMGLVGLFFNPLLVFIALFVWLGAAQEAQSAEMKSAFAGVTVGQVMVTHFQSLKADDSVEVAAQYVLAGFQEDFPVTDDGRLVGVLTRDGLLRALARGLPDLRVSEAMQKDYAVASPSDSVVGVVQKIKSETCGTVPVVSEDQLLGLVTLHNVGEYLLIGKARNAHGGSGPGVQERLA